MATCKFCEKQFRSTKDREEEGVCMICHQLEQGLKMVLNFHGKKTLSRIVLSVLRSGTKEL